MITLKEAAEIIVKSGKIEKITRIHEYPDCWTFCDGIERETSLIPAVMKKDGRVWGMFPPNYKNYSKGKRVPLSKLM